jgi:predicted chitinase
MRRDQASSGDSNSRSDEHIGTPGKRTLTQGLVLRKAFATPGPDGEAAVARAGASTGAPLPDDLRLRFESCLDTDLTGVRVHTGAESTAAAEAVGARAYALGNDVHFAAGQYDPSSAAGQHLIAHEVAHTVQQAGQTPARQDKLEIGDAGSAAEVEADAVADRLVRGETASIVGLGSAAPVIARAPTDEGWNEQYVTKGELQAHSGTYDQYKATLATQGATKSSSSAGGHKLTGPVTMDQMLEIFQGILSDLQSNKVPQGTVDQLLVELNTAFRTMTIDTVEARAAYFANAFSESNQFRNMTETALSETDKYATDPHSVTLDTAYLDKKALEISEAEKKKAAEQGRAPHPDGPYRDGGTIHARDGAGWDKSFIGRGATQVTHRDFYIQVIAVMEKRLGELDAKSADAVQLKEAIDEIKKDPAQAGNPKYAFLFSAAQMKMPFDAKGESSGDRAVSRGASPTVFMGPQDKQLPGKLAAGKRATEVFMRQHEAEKSGKAQGAAPDWLRDAMAQPSGEKKAE